MSGPYCGTCVHFKPDDVQAEHSVIIGVEYGDCLDPTKLIYYKRGEVKISPDGSVMSENYCSNHKEEE